MNPLACLRIATGTSVLVALVAAGPARAQCIPTEVGGVKAPLIAGANKLKLKKPLTVNGVSITGTGTSSLLVTGATSNSTAGTLPTLSPPTFPATGSGTLNTAGPVAAGSYGTIDSTGNPTVFTGGTYYIDTLKAKTALSLGPGTYFVKKFEFESSISVTGAVQIFVGDTFDPKKDGLSINAGGSAANLRINLYAGAEFKSEAEKYTTFTGFVYAPYSSTKVRFDDGAVFTGAVISAGDVEFKKNSSIQYDAAVQAQVASLACPVDHYELSLASSSITCLPTTVTITACADASSPCTSAFSAVNGTTATLSTSTGSLAQTSVIFDATGVATTTLSHPAAADGSVATVMLSGTQYTAAAPSRCCPDGGSCSVATACSTTFATAGFVVAAAGGSPVTIPTLVAGTASPGYVLRAVRSGTTNAACTAALTGAQDVDWAYECLDPTTCSGANLMSVNGGVATPIARNPDGAVSSYTAVPMMFDANGNAPFSFQFADVGQTALHMRKSVGAALLSGSSNAFVTRPARFAIAAVQQTASPFKSNPAASGAASAAFIRAGEAFSATVTSQTSTGAATPNFGKEKLAEGVRLTPAVVLPLGGSSGVLSNAVIGGASFSGGSATVTNLSWNEVGILALNPSVADGSYLGVGDVVSPASANIGRFVPARLALSGPSVLHRSAAAPACVPASTFTYLGENFRVGVTLTAQDGAGNTTTNYRGDFAKFDPSAAAAWNLRGVAGTTTFSTTNGRLVLGSASGTWNNGVTTAATLTAAARSVAPPEGPYAIQLGMAPQDSDGVGLQAFDLATAPPAAPDRALVGTVAARLGRLRMSNAFSSEKSSLQLPVQAEYWSGQAWVPNAADNCTTVPAAAVARSGYLDHRGAPTAAWTTTASAVAITAGTGVLTLSAPTPAATGSVDIALNLGPGGTDQSCLSAHPATAGANLPWLRARNGACATTWDRDPAARASFGIASPESRRTVHARELF
jgi:MSHA biogenesis protein MshQ